MAAATGRLGVYLEFTSAEKDWVRSLAKRQGISVNLFMRRLLHDYIRTLPKAAEEEPAKAPVAAGKGIG